MASQGTDEIDFDEVPDDTSMSDGDNEQNGEEDDPPDLTNESTTVDPYDFPIPSFLKEISSLASWTVSTYKPGCGVQALRHPSALQYWQSDGPQPHTLSLHFFKLVDIALVRIYLDFALDESYTPTKMQFLAGTGHHDLQDVCEMTFEQPKGWIDVDLHMAGGPPVFRPDEIKELDVDLSDMSGLTAEEKQVKYYNKARLHTLGGTLRCFLLQVKILENHQNGKDTHLRGMQIYARDNEALKRNAQRPFRPVRAADASPRDGGKGSKKARKQDVDTLLGVKASPWMDELELR